MADKTEFKVRITYREPTYESRTGPKAMHFTCTYHVKAVDKASAISLAIEEFRTTAKLSSVGWVRNIVSAEAIVAEEL